MPFGLLRLGSPAMAFGRRGPSGRDRRRQSMGGARRLSNKEERNMRAILIPALAALGIALAGTSATMAAPANGEVIGQVLPSVLASSLPA